MGDGGYFGGWGGKLITVGLLFINVHPVTVQFLSFKKKHVHTQINACTHAHTHSHTCNLACLHTHTDTHTHTKKMHACIHTHTHNTHACACIHTNTLISTC